MGWVLETNFINPKDLIEHLGFWPDDLAEDQIESAAADRGIPLLTEEENRQICSIFSGRSRELIEVIATYKKKLEGLYQAESPVHLDCLVAGLGLNYWLLAWLRKRELEIGVWQKRSSRQNVVTAFAVDPSSGATFSRVRTVAGGPRTRLCILVGGAFSGNIQLWRSLDNPEVSRILETLDSSGELVLSGLKGKILEDSGVVAYRSRGFSGSWRVSVPVFNWQTVRTVSDCMSEMAEEISKILAPAVADLMDRYGHSRWAGVSGPGDYLEMSYSVAAGLAISQAVAQGAMFRGLGAADDRAKRMGIRSLFGRQKKIPYGCFVLLDAVDIWRYLVSLLLPVE